MMVKLGDGTPLGSIEQRRGFVCCNRFLEVRDHEERLLYTLAGPMQFGPNCIPGCQHFSMKLHDVKGDNVGSLSNAYRLNTSRGALSAMTCGCCTGCSMCPCESADKYALSYPPEATVEDKLLLLSSNLALDFMLFQSPFGWHVPDLGDILRCGY